MAGKLTPPSSPKTRFLRSPYQYRPPHLPLSTGSVRVTRRPRKIIYLLGIFFLLYWFGIRHGLGIERQVPPPLGFAIAGGRRGRRSALRYDARGMATLQSTLPGTHPDHPIYELMEHAEQRWNRLLQSQSTTLERAVDEYRRRYRMDPPAGFDAWFAWCKSHGVTIVDEYDQLMKDLLIHHALPPDMFIARSEALEGGDFTYTLDVTAQGVDLSGPRAPHARPRKLQSLIQGFQDALPKDFHLRVTGSDHDTGSQVVGRDQRERAMELVRNGKHFDEGELKHLENHKRTPAWGWFKACSLDSPANIRPGAENATHDLMPKSFIFDHMPTMEFCDFPELKRLHGAMHIDYEDRSRSQIKPVLVLSKFPGDASFQTTPLEAYTNLTDEDAAYLGRWEDKTENRLFWRGSTTGGYNVHRDWKESHRMRLHLMINGPKGGDIWWDKGVRDVMVPDGENGYKVVRRWEKVLSAAYTDVKLAGGAHQCPTPALCEQVGQTIEFGEKVWPEEAAVYKYALDVDGNGWSSRFHRLLSSGSPVLKMTMFPEWNMEVLTPWYHYIPLKPDYSDVYDIMAFFVGPVDDKGIVDEALGHDHLARKIGEAGQRFALEHWRWVDMQAYTFRLVLELRRLHSLDREAVSYHTGTERT
ncbi:hypothetical protein JCM24511_02969 [Saitozyma sp. JCM 24511]|nr:hypothetical protein JCM24511_02969 [Saitozyma sp. JCM 24511]